MTIKELIEELKKHDENKIVRYYDSEYLSSYDINFIVELTDGCILLSEDKNPRIVRRL